MGRKLGDGCAPLGEGELSPHLTQCGQGRGHTCTSSFIWIRPTVWPQYTNVTDIQVRTGQRTDSIGRTVLQTVAQKLFKFLFVAKAGAIKTTNIEILSANSKHLRQRKPVL